jgi:peptidyl-tRNA hydrolase, PTH1 family
MSDAWLIAGLGNPGPDYSATRHNVGYMAVDRIAAMTGGKLSRHKRANAMVLEGRLGLPGSQTPIILVEPLSYMNESGGPIKALMQFYDIPVERLMAIHDELDIPFSALRVKLGGGDNGHNGLKSMRKALGTGDFYRVRIGIGRPPGRQDPADFVLKPFASSERADLAELIERAADASCSLITDGLERTQSMFNTGPAKE